jgi:transcriptional regulator with XRE-family HTH domain
MAPHTRTYSNLTIEAARLLGARVSLARRERQWTLKELAERVGVTSNTMHKVERGDPTIGLGIALETAAVLGIPLFDQDRARRRIERGRIDDRLAVLPKQVRKISVDDEF